MPKDLRDNMVNDDGIGRHEEGLKFGWDLGELHSFALKYLEKKKRIKM